MMKINHNSQNISLLYIAGYGRSGSTLLDTILGNHPKIFGGGELTNLFEELLNDCYCSCGEKYKKCDFWKQILKENQELLPKNSYQKAKILTSNSESFYSINSNNQDYLDLWKTMIISIGKVSKRNIIIDSSKTNRKTWNRISLLSQCGFKVKVIHLVRDPRAVMWSILRGCNKRLEAEVENTRYPGGAIRGLIGWTISNIAVEVMKVKNPLLEIIVVRYEDFVANPINELSRIGHFLGIDMQCLISYVNNNSPFESGHGVSGNRMRRKTTIYLKEDTQWINKLPYHLKKMALLSLPLMKKYKYFL